MLEKEMTIEAEKLNIKITISQELEPLGTGKMIFKSFIKIKYIFFYKIRINLN